MGASIDIVIPSFRLNEHYLLPMLQMAIPAGFTVNYYIIADNPSIQVHASVLAFAQQPNVHLLINSINLGFCKTRNKGIDAGQGDWILLLDDDVLPDVNLLNAYARQIVLKPDALGFVGVTEFPPVMNAVTQALYVTGVSTHFQRARHEVEMYWSATANIMLNRQLLGTRRFLPELTKSTEDMELLFRNAFENSLKKYQAVPDAIVVHPWWDNGKMQTLRLFRYGEGAAEVARLYPVSLYNFYDFTNTTETIVLCVLSLLLASLMGFNYMYIVYLAIAQLLAEYLTNYYRTVKVNKSYNAVVALQVMWHKNTLEAGRFWGSLSHGYIKGFAQRTEGSFRKPNPQNFRLNRYKIFKLITFILLIAILMLV